MRIAFAGTPQFAVPTLRALADSPHQLVGVLTQPDRPAGRGRQLQSSPVKQLALQLALPVSQPVRLSTAEQRAELASWKPQVLVVVAYGLILPPAVLALPARGCINVHASLLPRWRGAAPIQHALLAGDPETGITIMQMEAGLDTGPVLSMQRVPIGGSTTAAELHDSLAPLGAALLLETLEALQAGSTRAQPQAREGISYAPKIVKQQAQIDWSLDAERIGRQVRAFNPWPVAQTTWQGTQLRIWEAQVAEASAPEPRNPSRLEAGAPAPGTVLGAQGEHLWVLCGQGVLAIKKLQLAGRRIVGAREFAGACTPIGARLGD